VVAFGAVSLLFFFLLCYVQIGQVGLRPILSGFGGRYSSVTYWLRGYVVVLRYFIVLFIVYNMNPNYLLKEECVLRGINITGYVEFCGRSFAWL
jgi:hypothetical protein